jgi:hypothetical protein
LRGDSEFAHRYQDIDWQLFARGVLDGYGIAATFRMPLWCAHEGEARLYLTNAIVPRLRNHLHETCLLSAESGIETGGLLLGWIEQYYPLLVRIEDFEEIPCEHRFGVRYVLSDTDRARLWEMLRDRRGKGTSQIVGFFRGYCGREPVLDEFDQELFSTYFLNRTDVLLLLKSTSATHCCATFRFGYESSTKPLPPLFSFSEGLTPVTKSELLRESLTVLDRASSVNVVGAPTVLPPSDPGQSVNLEIGDTPGKNRPWLLAVGCAFFAVAAYVGWMIESGRRIPAPILGAQQVNSITADRSLVADPSLAASARPKQAGARGIQAQQTTASTLRGPVAAIAVQPTIRHKVQPDIPAGVRARITDRIEVPVRVRVSSTGKVIAAVPKSGRTNDGLYRYLATRAGKAALLWSFTPAKTKDGTAILTEETISFVFTPE